MVNTPAIALPQKRILSGWLQSGPQLLLLLLLCNTLITLLHVTYQQPLNPDGLLYLDAAADYLTGGSAFAFARYSWPFYPILIAWLSKTLLLDPITISNSLNVIFLTLLQFYFLRISNLLAKPKHLIVPFIVILFCPFLVNQRLDIIRGFGFWAFILAGLYYFILGLTRPSLRYSLLGYCSILLSTLFRVEAIAFLLGCGLIQLYYLYQATSLVGKFSVATCAAIIVAAFYFSLIHHDFSQTKLHDYHFLIKTMLVNYKENLPVILNNARAYLPAEILPHNQWVLFFIYPFLLVGKKLLSGLGLLLVLAVAFNSAYFKKANFQRKVALTLITVILLNLVICVLFVGIKFVLSARYLTLALLLLLIFCVPCLQDMLKPSQSMVKKSLAVLVLLQLVLSGIFHFGPNKSYIVDAGHWIRHHHPHVTTILDHQVAFYANVDWQLNPKLGKTKYIAFNQSRHTPATQDEAIPNQQYQTIKVFSNKRGDRVVIRKRP